MKIQDALILRLNQVRDDTSLPAEQRLGAENLAASLQAGSLSEQEFIAQANSFLGITRVDTAGAFNRSFALHAPRVFSLPDNLHAKIFGNPDRGQRVTLVEKAIQDGLINPVEVLNA